MLQIFEIYHYFVQLVGRYVNYTVLIDIDIY